MPGIYPILTRTWIAALDPSVVVVADTYTYLDEIGQVLAQGFPRAAWRLVGDDAGTSFSARCALANTLLAMQGFLAIVFTIIICTTAPSFVDSYVPATVQAASASYVRMSVVSVACSMTVSCLSICARALDEPDIPLTISLVKYSTNIALDLILLSKFRPVATNVSVGTQAMLRMICDLVALTAGLLFFFGRQYNDIREICLEQEWNVQREYRRVRPSVRHFKQIVRAGFWFQLEVICRAPLELVFNRRIVSYGQTFATANGVFASLRMGLAWIPAVAIVSSCDTFVGHAWGRLHATGAIGGFGWTSLRDLFRPVAISLVLMLVSELALFFSIYYGYGQKLFLLLSGSTDVASLALEIWRRVDWGYIFLGLYFQLSSLLLVGNPLLYFTQSFTATLLCLLPATVLAYVKTGPDQFSWDYFVAAIAASGLVQFVFALAATALLVRRLRQPSPSRVPEVTRSVADSDGNLPEPWSSPAKQLGGATTLGVSSNDLELKDYSSVPRRQSSAFGLSERSQATLL